jgi:hypothetical protein
MGSAQRFNCVRRLTLAAIHGYSFIPDPSTANPGTSTLTPQPQILLATDNGLQDEMFEPVSSHPITHLRTCPGINSKLKSWHEVFPTPILPRAFAPAGALLLRRKSSYLTAKIVTRTSTSKIREPLP